MDISKFQNNAAGKTVPIGGGDHAFIPDPLPPNWVLSESHWKLLAEANKQIGILEGLGRNLPNPGILLRPLEDREALQSSRLEGTYITPKELLLFEMQPNELKPGEDKANDWREVFNCRKALQFGANSELPLSLRLIRDLHRILLTNVRGKDRTPGEFRRMQVAIGMSRRFVPPPPERLMECLDPFEQSLHAVTKYDPLIDCFLAHYQFETIHPFIDGNGRVGRLLLVLMLQKKCELSRPWLYLSGYFEKNREEYVNRLFDVSANGAWDDWIEFCLRATVHQAKDTIERCDRLRKIREDYMQSIKTVGGSVRLNQIVEDLFHSPFIQVSNLAKKLGVTYPTAQSDIDRLVAAEILKKLENTSQKTYYAPQVFEIAYADIDQ